MRLVIRGMPMRMKFLGLAQVLSSATFIGLQASVIMLATATTFARADTVVSDDSWTVREGPTFPPEKPISPSPRRDSNVGDGLST
jgi:hypothetical protein